MVKYYIDNNLTKLVKSRTVFDHLTDDEHVRLYDEVRNACLQGIDEKLCELVRSNFFKEGNPTNSLLMFVLGLYHDKPDGAIKIKSEGSYPDYDLDYQKLNREKVIDHLKDMYGLDKVANVVTFGTLGAKGSIRSAARALGYTVADGDHVAKMIPVEPDITIQMAIENSDTLKEIIDKKEQPYKHIIDVALELEGLSNASGVHASGLIISDLPLHSYVPLMISKKDGGGITTQFEYKDAEANMLIKLDILGLQTLDIIQESLLLINKNHKKNLSVDSIDVNDKSIYKLLNDGHSSFVFQFESSIFQQAVSKSNPQNVNDLGAISSLMRPGCLVNKIDQQYYLAKVNGEKYDYGISDKKLLSAVWDICKETFGLLIYQEQTIACAVILAGFDEISGDNFRRAIGKKQNDIIELERAKFLDGCVKNGYNRDDSSKLFDQLALYSLYQFNKSHCLSGDTLIECADSTFIRLDDIGTKIRNNTDVLLKSYDYDNDRIFIDKCIKFYDNGKQELFEVELEDGSIIKCTENHKFLCDDGKMHILKDIILNDLSIVSCY
jgi:DNA polymerase-3 subunit alpha